MLFKQENKCKKLGIRRLRAHSLQVDITEIHNFMLQVKILLCFFCAYIYIHTCTYTYIYVRMYVCRYKGQWAPNPHLLEPHKYLIIDAEITYYIKQLPSFKPEMHRKLPVPIQPSNSFEERITLAVQSTLQYWVCCKKHQPNQIPKIHPLTMWRFKKFKGSKY